MSSFHHNAAEVEAVRTAVGLIDRSEVGKLVISGSDRYTWLQGMVSNDVRPLTEGVPSLKACILNATGQMLADLTIVNHHDSLLLDLPRETVERLFHMLDGYVITEDVEIVEQTDFLACLSLQGPLATIEWLNSFGELNGTVVEADHTGSGGLDVYLRRDHAVALNARLGAAGVPTISPETANLLRIEAGIPLYGVDMNEKTIPLEAGLESTHISHQKGCYVGQEIIARIHARGHTNRALTGFRMVDGEAPEPGSRLLADDREVGWLTSISYSPAKDSLIALGFLRHELREDGALVQVESGQTVEVVSLPFYSARS